MTIRYELDLNSFEAWSGAKETLERIQREGKCTELENILEELYPDGMTETELNDLLWFDSESFARLMFVFINNNFFSTTKRARLNFVLFALCNFSNSKIIFHM